MKELVLLYASIAASVVADGSVPLFMWSPQSWDSSASQKACTTVEDTTVRSLDDVRAMLDLQHTSPEVLVATVYPAESSASFSRMTGAFSEKAPPAFQFVQHALAKAKTCGTFANLQRSSEDPTWEEALRQELTSLEASVITLPNESDCATVKQALLQRPAIFTNSIVDLVLLPHTAATCMHEVLKVVEAETKSSFISLVAANPPPTKMITEFDTTPDAHPPRRKLLVDTSAGTGMQSGGRAPLVGIQYVNAPILAGLFLSFFMLFFLYVGVACLMSIQAPARFATEPLPVPKEY